jgi:hypothetical protein
MQAIVVMGCHGKVDGQIAGANPCQAAKHLLQDLAPSHLPAWHPQHPHKWIAQLLEIHGEEYVQSPRFFKPSQANKILSEVS